MERTIEFQSNGTPGTERNVTISLRYSEICVIRGTKWVNIKISSRATVSFDDLQGYGTKYWLAPSSPGSTLPRKTSRWRERDAD